MKIIDRYIFRALWAPFLAGFLGTMVIVTFGNTLRGIRLLAEGNVDRMDIFWWYVFRIPEDVQFVFPVATLLATLMVFGQLSKQSELTALRAAGINPARLALPVAVFGLFNCFVLFHTLDEIVPRGMSRSQKIWKEKIRANQSLHAFKERILMKDKTSALIYVGRYDLKSHRLQYVIIRDYDPDTAEFTRQVAAPEGVYLCAPPEPGDRRADEKIEHQETCRTKNHWSLSNAAIQIPRPRGPMLIRKKSMVVALGAGPEDFAREERSPAEMTGSELLAEIRRLEERGLADTLRLKVELYLKSSFPFCVLIFCVIGCVMGFTSNRTGGFIGFGLALLITFLYYISMSLSASLGKTGVLHPLVSAWVHNFVYMGVAIYLVFRAQSR